ncbi:hypothetical protein KKC97_06040, partial [bacterium]|nr:hypothetical protein [bacterium]
RVELNSTESVSLLEQPLQTVVISYQLLDSLIMQNCRNITLRTFGTEFLINHCEYTAGYNAFLFLENSRGTIQNSTFSSPYSMHSGANIQIEEGSHIAIERCVFEDDSSCQIGVTATLNGSLDTTKACIRHCTFHNTHEVFVRIGRGSIAGYQSTEISNCIFNDSDDKMISLSANTGTLDVTIRNNCFWQANELFYCNTGQPLCSELGVLIDRNANGDSVDAYNNIFLDPLFADSLFTLTAESPCIDAGFDYGQDYWGAAPDIGYREYTGDIIRGSADDNSDSDQAYGLSIFPNPTNSSVIITGSQLPTNDLRQLRVYDILGREVAKLIVPAAINGAFRFNWNLEDAHGHPLPTGSYFFLSEPHDLQPSIRLTIIR